MGGARGGRGGRQGRSGGVRAWAWRTDGRAGGGRAKGDGQERDDMDEDRGQRTGGDGKERAEGEQKTSRRRAEKWVG